MSQKKTVDKVNMSLDDIIKLNRNQNRQNKFSANRNFNNSVNNNNNNKQNGNKNNFQRRNGNNNKQVQQRRQQPQQNQINNKPYGMLNRSKTIQKRSPNVRILQAQQNNQQQQQRKMARFNGNQANRIPRNRRRRLPNGGQQQRPQFNRFSPAGGLASRIKFQNGQKNNGNINNHQNRSQKFAIKPQLVNLKSQPQRKRLLQPRTANNVKTKIAMQSARKNVMKAKRLLVNKITKKGPIQQIMTQRYAKSIGLVQTAGAKIKRVNGNGVRPLARKPVQRSSKMLTVNINNRINKINRVKQQQRKALQKTAQITRQQFRGRKPQQQAKQSNAGRKVFF